MWIISAEIINIFAPSRTLMMGLLILQKLAEKTQVPAKRAVSGFDKSADKKETTSHPPTISQKVDRATVQPHSTSVVVFMYG